MILKPLLFVLCSYLLGAIPFGWVIVKSIYKQEIRDIGSGNPGATNVWRCFGKWPGMTTLALDIAKGFVPVFLTRRAIPGTDLWPILAGIAAIVGHNWSVFLMGKGGKGVATSAGVFLALLPRECGIALGIFLITLLISKRVSISSLTAAAALVLVSFFFPKPFYFHAVVILAGTMILVKHIPNLKRLIKGDEPKVTMS